MILLYKVENGMALAKYKAENTHGNELNAHQRRPAMKTLLMKLQRNMTAAAFAEAGEWEAAKEVAPAAELSRESSKLNRIFTAVTFAEAGLPTIALLFLKPEPARQRVRTTNLAEELGLRGVRLMYGTVTIH